MTSPTVDLNKPAKKTPDTKKEPRPTVGELLRQWVPDPRWAHPLIGAMWLYCVAIAVTRPGFAVPPAALALLAPIGVGLSVARSKRTYPEHDYGHDVGHSMAWLGGVASVLSAAWLVYAGIVGPWRALPWLLLVTIWGGGWYAFIRTGAPKRKAELDAAREEARIEAVTATWQGLLRSSNLGLRVVSTKPTRAGYVLGVEPVDPGKPVTFSTLQSKLTELTTLASAALAKEGVTVGAGTIRVEETEAAHVHLIHVCTKQILRESIPFEPFERAPGTIVDPLDFALYEDGREVTAPFGGDQGGTSGQIVGATGSGKSRTVNSMIGRIGECGDALVGVVASSKLVPAVYPWIKPWVEGKADQPALDFVAGQTPEQVLLMLAALYRIVCDRNDRLSNEATHVPTPEEPAIVVFVEEAGDMATRTATILTHDGQKVGFSQLIHMILRQCRSAQVSLWTLNQTALYGALGDYGPEIQRNTPYRICLKTLAPQDGTAVLPGLGSWGDTAKLRHNSQLVQPSIDDPRVMPAKSYNLGGGLIEPVAIRNGQWRPDLEASLVEQLEEVWTGRWDAARLPELAHAAQRDGLVWPVGRVEDDVDDELRQMLEQETITLSKETSVPDETRGPAEMPDAEAAIAELREIAAQPALTLPEPLSSVMALLREPQAPKDWISTQQLAILLGRVDADASVEQRRAAAQKLGREMSTIDPALRAEPKDRLQGYDVPNLKKTAARIAREGR